MTDSFNQPRGHVIPERSIGLDGMSSADVFGDIQFLRNVRTVPNTMRIICNAKMVVVKNVGDFKGYGPVWFHKNSISNIL